MHGIDALGRPLAVLVGSGLLVCLGTAVRAAWWEQREFGSCRKWEAARRALDEATR